MSIFTVRDRMQSVTTLVTYKDMAGDLYLILVRPDPRHRDKEGKSLRGEYLRVGPCQFVGGRVEDTTLASERDSAALLAITNDGNRSHFHYQVGLSAVREIAEEISLDIVKFFQGRSGDFRWMYIVNRDDDFSGRHQDIQYFNLHLGTLNPETVTALRHAVSPKDDVIQALHVKAASLRMDPDGEITVNTTRAHVATKMEFTGFPDIGHWISDYKDALDRLEERDALNERFNVLAELRNFIDMDANVRGLTGINHASLYASSIGMYDPAIPGEKSDGEILAEFLQREHGIYLGYQDKVNVPANPVFVMATRNAGKVRELQHMLGALPVEVIDLDEMERRLYRAQGTLGDPAEPGATYEENASIKAQAVASYIRKSRLLSDKNRYVAIADDSGLELAGLSWKKGSNTAKGECDRLAGRAFPGVDTKPFVEACGGEAQAHAFYETVIRPDRELKAVVVLAVKAVLSPENDPPYVFRGTMAGTMVQAPRGKGGFAFDPIFQPVGSTKTLAEMTLAEKNAISHRRDVMEKFLKNLVFPAGRQARLRPSQA